MNNSLTPCILCKRKNQEIRMLKHLLQSSIYSLERIMELPYSTDRKPFDYELIAEKALFKIQNARLKSWE